MRSRIHAITVGLVAVLGLREHSGAQTELPVQAAARPYNLDIAGPVYQSGSDAASAAFNAGELPRIVEFLDANLAERTALQNITAYSLDPAKPTLGTEAEVRVYFVGEGAGYHNTLGLSIEDASGQRASELIFPDASSRFSWYADGSQSPTAGRNATFPLMAGDFVDVGTVAGGSALDFFLIAQGASDPNAGPIWWAEASRNIDHLQHVAAFAMVGSPYLLLGFEDQTGGGDLDYNDVVFAVDIGLKNVQHLANPEPPALLTFGVLTAGLIGIGRQRARRGAGGAGARHP